MIKLLHSDQIDQRLPLYQRLKEQIARRVAAGEWRPGDVIPTEVELAETHRVAVGTVRRAIQSLVEDGLIEKVQGKGTFVRRPNFDSSFARFLRFHGRGGRHEVPDSRILSRAITNASAEVARHLKVRPASRMIRLERIRHLAEHPILAEEIWLSAERFEPLLGMETSDFGPLLYPLYERVCGEVIASAEETLTVESADETLSTRLEIPVGAPVVKIERLAFGFDRRPSEWRCSWAPASSFRYQIEIR